MKIINIKDYGSSPDQLDAAFGDAWVYVGRRSWHPRLPQSPLANTYSVKRYGRERAITMYRAFLWWKMREQKDPDVLDALRALTPDSILVCWCAPLDCHARIITNASRWLKRQD